MSQSPEAVEPPQNAQHLADLLRMDTWTVHEGLSEIVRDYVSTLSVGDVLAGMRLHARLQQLWDSGDHPPGRLKPGYFVAWAAQKRYPLSWEAWAKKEGWLDDRATVTSLQRSKAKAMAKQGLAAARAALDCANDSVAVHMPRDSKLAVAFLVYQELCAGGQIPMHKILSAAIDEKWKKVGSNGAASPEARSIATLLLATAKLRSSLVISAA